MEFTAVTNQNLQAIDSPINGTSPTTPTNFSDNNERGAVGVFNIGTINANLINSGTIVVSLSLGGPYVTIDGANQRILVNDGTVNRIILGYQSGGF